MVDICDNRTIRFWAPEAALRRSLCAASAQRSAARHMRNSRFLQFRYLRFFGELVRWEAHHDIIVPLTANECRFALATFLNKSARSIAMDRSRVVGKDRKLTRCKLINVNA